MTGPPAPMGDPSVSNRGWETHWSPSPQPIRGDQTFLRKMWASSEAARHWDQRLKIAKGRGEQGGEDPEDVMEAQRSRGAGEEKSYSKAGA